MKAKTIDVSVIIPTFHRTHLLQKAISSVARQQVALELQYEIIVVDNSSEKSAEALIACLAKEHTVAIRYVSEPRKNIALARNAGVAASRARLIAFIDDDEQASPEWLQTLVQTQREHKADVVFGPVFPVFESGAPPSWDPQARLYFLRNRDAPTGTPVKYGPTSNVLLNSETCVFQAQPFDPALGLTGGEDTDFFMRLSKMGRKLIWCAEAKVNEFVPYERLHVSYILRRRLRSGQTHTWCCVRNSNRPVLTAAKLMFVGFGQMIVWFFPSMILAPFHTPFAVWVKGRMILGLGKLFWGRYFRFDFYS